MVFKERVKQFLGPRTEWVPAPTEKQITHQSRGSAFLVVFTLSVLTFWTMVVARFDIRYWLVDLYTLGIWAITVWASYCGVVEVSSMKISAMKAARASEDRKKRELETGTTAPGQMTIRQMQDTFQNMGLVQLEND